MHKDDFPQFVAMLDDVWGLKGQALTAGQKAMFFRALSEYSLDAVRSGLDAHIKTPKKGTFLPMPADVIEQIEGKASQDGRPGAEEAWAMSLKSKDEFDTVVWTSEMAEAWGVSQAVFELGDEVGARMAFKETYLRLVDASRRQRQGVQWIVSEGFDKSKRDSVITDAVRLGRLDGGDFPLLEAPTEFLQLTNGAAESASAKNRQMVSELLERLKAPRPEPMSMDAAARADTEARKAESSRKVAEYQSRQGGAA